MVGMIRGTSRPREHDVAEEQPVDAGDEAGPEQERPLAHGDQRVTGDPDCEELGPGGAGEVLRSVTTDSTLMTPTTMRAASTTREVTKPIAALLLTRRVAGYSATAVAIPDAQ